MRRRSTKAADTHEPVDGATEHVSSVEAQHAPKSGVRKHIDELGGFVIFGWRLARLLACVALCALSVYTVILDPQPARGASESHYSRWLQISLTVVYVRLMPLPPYSAFDIIPFILGVRAFVVPGLSSLQRGTRQNGNTTPHLRATRYICCFRLPRYMAVGDIHAQPTGCF